MILVADSFVFRSTVELPTSWPAGHSGLLQLSMFQALSQASSIVVQNSAQMSGLISFASLVFYSSARFSAPFWPNQISGMKKQSKLQCMSFQKVRLNGVLCVQKQFTASSSIRKFTDLLLTIFRWKEFQIIEAFKMAKIIYFLSLDLLTTLVANQVTIIDKELGDF